MQNTIILYKGEVRLTHSEYNKFSKGDTIWGDGYAPEEVNRWSIDQKQDAVDALKNYTCTYTADGELHNITEYALEYCECDEDGEFVEGSDYTLAAEMA